MTYAGHMIDDLYARVDNAIDLSRKRCEHDWRGIDTGKMCAKCGLGLVIEARRSSVDSKSGWNIIVCAQGHLCDHVMEAGDVQAWHVLTDLQEQLLDGQPETQCQAWVSRSASDQDGELCGQPVLLGTEFCEGHQI